MSLLWSLNARRRLSEEMNQDHRSLELSTVRIGSFACSSDRTQACIKVYVQTLVPHDADCTQAGGAAIALGDACEAGECDTTGREGMRDEPE